jgi:hypothetical protein
MILFATVVIIATKGQLGRAARSVAGEVAGEQIG